MDVSRIRALRGPNLWTRHTAIEAIVSCASTSCAMPPIREFEARVRALFPAIGALRTTRAQPPRSLAHVLESAALALQAEAGCPVTFSRTSATVDPDVYQVVVEYSEEEVGRLAFELAEALVQAAVQQQPFDVEAAIARLRETPRGCATRPEHRRHRRRRRRPRHPLAPPHAGQPGAVRLGLPPASHPGGGTRCDQRRGRGHRAGQGPDQDPAAGRGRAGALWATGVERRRSLGRGLRDRTAGGGEAPGRQPGARASPSTSRPGSNSTVRTAQPPRSAR